MRALQAMPGVNSYKYGFRVGYLKFIYGISALHIIVMTNDTSENDLTNPMTLGSVAILQNHIPTTQISPLSLCPQFTISARSLSLSLSQHEGQKQRQSPSISIPTSLRRHFVRPENVTGGHSTCRLRSPSPRP